MSRRAICQAGMSIALALRKNEDKIATSSTRHESILERGIEKTTPSISLAKLSKNIDCILYAAMTSSTMPKMAPTIV